MHAEHNTGPCYICLFNACVRMCAWGVLACICLLVRVRLAADSAWPLATAARPRACARPQPCNSGTAGQTCHREAAAQ